MTVLTFEHTIITMLIKYNDDQVDQVGTKKKIVIVSCKSYNKYYMVESSLSRATRSNTCPGRPAAFADGAVRYTDVQMNVVATRRVYENF